MTKGGINIGRRKLIANLLTNRRCIEVSGGDFPTGAGGFFSLNAVKNFAKSGARFRGPIRRQRRNKVGLGPQNDAIIQDLEIVRFQR